MLRRELFRQSEIVTLAVAIRIRAKSDVDPLRGINHVEMRSSSETTRSHCAMPALKTTAASHIKFVNNRAPIDIGDADMQNQFRSADSKVAEEKAPIGISAVDQVKITFNEPASAGFFAVLENSRRRDFFQLFL